MRQIVRKTRQDVRICASSVQAYGIIQCNDGQTESVCGSYLRALRKGDRSMIRIAIVDDQSDVAETIEKYISQYAKETGQSGLIVEKYDNALEFLDEYKPDTDIVFMDVDMPLMNGYDAARRLRAAGNDMVLVFVTRMATYAVKGYEVNATSFIVKPVTYGEFALKFRKALGVAYARRSGSIWVRTDREIKVLPVADIYYIEVIKHYTFIHAKDGVYRQQVPLKELEDKLKDAPFARCNNCYLVNLGKVTSADKDYVTVGGDKLQVSRNKRHAFFDALTCYLNGGRVI